VSRAAYLRAASRGGLTMLEAMLCNPGVVLDLAALGREGAEEQDAERECDITEM
jgi:hypothetical protein